MTHACESPPPAELVTLATWAYRAEVFGESLFAELARTAPTDRVRECFELLARLELQTADSMAALLERLSVERPAPDEDRQRGIEAAGHLAELEPAEIWQAVIEGTEPAFAKYDRLRQLVPRGEDATMAAVVDHENALAQFAAAEQRGDTDARRYLRTVLRASEADKT